MKNLKNIAILVLIACVVTQFYFGKSNGVGKTMLVDGKKYEVIKEIHDTTEVTKVKTLWKKGQDIFHETILHDTAVKLVNVDTAALLRDYFAKNIYKDTLRLPDSLGFVFLTDTITKNKIEGRKFTANVKQRVINNTTIVKELPKTKVFYGIEGGFNKADFISSVGMGLLINTKSDRIFNLGLGVNNRTTDGTNGSFSPYVKGGVYWKIKLKK